MNTMNTGGQQNAMPREAVTSGENVDFHRRRRRRRLFWLAGLALFLFVAIPTAFAASPTMPWYPVQRMGESLITNLAPVEKDFFRAMFAARRVRDAKYLTERLPQRSATEQSKDTAQIKKLLQEYRVAFKQVTNNLAQQLDSGKKLSPSFFARIEEASILLYLDINDQRLEAPAAAQADVLQALETAHTNQATLADVLQRPPISAEDTKNLTDYVAAGLMTKDQLTDIMSGITSNRQFLEALRDAVRQGTLPASVLSAIQEDLITKYAPDQLAHYQATVNFDEMRKIALLIKSITPTAAQKKTIAATLADYVPGNVVASDQEQEFIRPMLYGLFLARRLPADLQQLDVNELQAGRRLFYETWKPLATTKTTDVKEMYDQALSLVDQHIARNTDLLQQIQFEVLSALRSEVVYMALPPGWTQEQVIALQPAFEQLIQDVARGEIIQKQTAQTTADLVNTTTPLAAPLSNAELEKIRQETRQKLMSIRKQLTILSVSSTIPAGTMATIQQNMATMKEQVDTSIQSVVATVSAPTETLTKQVTELQAALTAALAAANQAIADVQVQAATNASLHNDVQTTVAALNSATDKNKTDLERRLASLETASGAAASLQTDINGIVAGSQKNIEALNTQLADALKSQAELKVGLSESIQAQADTAAELAAQLNLSASARLALKDEVAAVIAAVKTDQAAAVAKLEKTITDNAALNTQATAAVTTDIATMKTAQTQMIANLQTQVNSQDLLKSQVEASVDDLKASSQALKDDVDGLKPAQANLSQFVAQLKTDQAAAAQAIQTNTSDTAKLRSDLEQSVASIQTAQAAATANLTSGLESLTLELRQSMADVQAAAAATASQVATLGTTVDQAKAGIATLTSTQATASVTIQAHTTAITDLSSDLRQSLVQLQQAQTQTQTELNIVKNDVSTLRQSVSDIQTAQAAADAKINQLLAASVNWTQIPGNAVIDQSVIDSVKAQLDAEFTIKSAALEAQYQRYHAQLNTDLTKLKTETDTQILRLQQEAATLKAEIQALQQTTTTTVTNTSTVPGVGL